jgi:hypothetical protein
LRVQPAGTQGSPRQPSMASAEPLGRGTAGPRGRPRCHPFIEAARPPGDAEKSEGVERVPDRGQHAVRGAGNAAGSGPAVLVAWPTGEGRRGTWQGGLQGASECSRPREGAAGPGRQGGGTARSARGRTGAGATSRSSATCCGVA